MQKIFNIQDLINNKYTSTTPIVIPIFILNAILKLCDLPIEYAGQLLLFNNIVEYPFISASGSAGAVFPEKKIVFNNSPQYTTIEFHTHPNLLGNFYMGNFSNGDMHTFNNRVLQEGNQYQHILFTGKNVITWGKNEAPDVRVGFGNTDVVIYNFNTFNKKHNCWKLPDITL